MKLMMINEALFEEEDNLVGAFGWWCPRNVACFWRPSVLVRFHWLPLLAAQVLITFDACQKKIVTKNWIRILFLFFVGMSVIEWSSTLDLHVVNSHALDLRHKSRRHFCLIMSFQELHFYNEPRRSENKHDPAGRNAYGKSQRLNREQNGFRSAKRVVFGAFWGVGVFGCH